MNRSTSYRGRTTAVVSTLVAVAILAAGTTAQQSRRARIDDLVQLESDLRFQLEAGFRHDQAERVERLTQVDRVMETWHQSSQAEIDRQRLANWLLKATIRSMPGSSSPLPDSPIFGKSETTQLIAAPEESSVMDDFAEEPIRVATMPLVAKTRAEKRVKKNVSLVVALVQPPRLADEPAFINLTKLTTRIAGYHDNLDRIENALLTFDGNDLGVITDSIERLDEMIRDFQFVKLYYGALSDDERNAVRPPRSMTATLATIEHQLVRREQNSSRDFLDDFDSPDRERVDELRKQLASISNRVE